MQACIFELIVVWNCRSETRNVFKTGLNNKYLLVSTVIGIALTVSLCYVPFLQDVFHTAPLPLEDWVWIIGSALLGLLVLPELFFRTPKKTKQQALRSYT